MTTIMLGSIGACIVPLIVGGIKKYRRVKQKVSDLGDHTAAEIDGILREIDRGLTDPEPLSENGVIITPPPRNDHVIRLGDELVERLRPFAKNIEISGKRRRGVEPTEVLIVMTPYGDMQECLEKVVTVLEKLCDDAEAFNVRRYLYSAYVRCYPRDVLAEINLVEQRLWGSALVTTTGCEFQQLLRARASHRALWWGGMDGLLDCQTNQRVADSEEEILTRLGLEEYLDPKTRA